MKGSFIAQQENNLAPFDTGKSPRARQKDSRQEYIVEVLAKLRAASHYGRRSRGRRFPPIKLQETMVLASRPFTLEAKVQRPWTFKMLTWQHFLTKVTASREEVWVLHFARPVTMVERPSISFIKIKLYFIGYFQ